MSAPRLRRALPPTLVPLAAALPLAATLPPAAAAVLPAPAAALTPAPQPNAFELSRPADGDGLDALVLRATCPAGCTVRLGELNVLRYRTRGGVEQLPHAGVGALRGGARVPAGRTVAIPVAFPDAVSGFALAALARREALFGNVTLTVTPAGGGAPVEAVRQFTATAPGTPAPFPATPTVDAIAIPKPSAARTARRARYRLTLAGTQTSRWSYDRTEQRGACRILDSGSGSQTLRFRSTRAVTVQELTWNTGHPVLQQVGTGFAGVFVPVRVEAERDGSETKGAEGGPDCGNYGGDRGTPPECVRRGTRDIFFMVGFVRTRSIHAFTTSMSFDRPSEAPDCPVEVAERLRDPLDVLEGAPAKGGWLANGGRPGKVIAVYRKRDTTRIGGGSVTTTARYTVTFRRIGS